MTPEQVAKAVEWARDIVQSGETDYGRHVLARALLAEHDRAERLAEQIGALARVLLEEFNGPTQDEGACEMAVRLLRDNARDAARWRAVREYMAARITRLYGGPSGNTAGFVLRLHSPELRFQDDNASGVTVEQLADRLVAEREAQS